MSGKDTGSATAQPWAIPDYWRWAEAGEIADVVGGGTPSTDDPANFEGGNIPWITPADLSGYDGKYISKGARNITEKGLAASSARMMPSGTVLMSSRAPVGYAAIAANPVCTNQGFRSFVLQGPVVPEYLYHYIKRAKDLIESLGSGTTFVEVSGTKAATIPVPLPPLPEQQRIVDAIEETLSKIDAGVASLERAKANLGRYRAAVLKAAVEGKLTSQWRAEHPGVEPASELLERILDERRETWEREQLEKYAERGKAPPKNLKSRYNEPEIPEVDGLPELPDDWVWTSVEVVAYESIRNGLYLPQSAYGYGVPILRIDDYQIGWSRPSEELRLVDAEEEDQDKFSLTPGDLVINRVNSPSHLGKCLLIEERNLPALFESNMMRLKLSACVEPRFIQLWLWSAPGRTELTKNAKWAVNQASINQQDVKATAVPLPPLAEQVEIVDEVERRLSVIDEIEKQINAGLKRAERLRQAILKKAFEGRLVPQDTHDEPAEDVLERIEAQS